MHVLLRSKPHSRHSIISSSPLINFIKIDSITVRFIKSILPFRPHGVNTSTCNHLYFASMSFLTEKMLRPMVRTIPRASIAFNAPRAAAFSVSMAARKTPVEAVKDAAKTVDRKVSDGLVTGIDAAGKPASIPSPKPNFSSY